MWDPDRTRSPRKGMNAAPLVAADGLYDPATTMGDLFREKAPTGEAASWADFDAFTKSHFANFSASGGKGLAFLVDGTIAATGTHSELLRTVPAYRAILSSDAEEQTDLEVTR